jgi:hypothetical protein
MKRIYMKPAVRVVKLQQRYHMLAGSPNGYVRGVSAPAEGFTLKEDGFADSDDDM